MKHIDRRIFLKNAITATLSLSCCRFSNAAPVPNAEGGNLYEVSDSLLRKWCKGLIDLQIQSDADPKKVGGIKCPSCNFIHGRIGDAIYPLMHIAHRDNDSRYADAALKLFRWTENNVSTKHGSWINDFENKWQGISVFGAIALAEALERHGSILDRRDFDILSKRLKKAADFIYERFSFKYGTINYPVSAAYALSLFAKIFDEKKYAERAKFFGRGALKYFTNNDKLLYGEGKPADAASSKGLYAVDLGYNVEESLPSLVGYALTQNDGEVLETAEESMKRHLEFMLPDGAWDNSWGTRNFKWTYWGSRTSDGCLYAYAMLADKNPAFYRAALENARLLDRCTWDNLLHGGPHYKTRGVPPCIHHSFAHAKCAASVLDNARPIPANAEKTKLPREREYGLKLFRDIDTALVSKGKFRATITAYDREYNDVRNGHPTGGALSLLWHENAGAIFAASMNDYRRIEPQNMQADNSPDSMPLTPRIEADIGGVKYRNISDLSAKMRPEYGKEKVTVFAESKLVDAEQKSPPNGEILCSAIYEFSDDGVDLKFRTKQNGDKKEKVKIILPLVSQSGETYKMPAKNSLVLNRENCRIKLSADKNIVKMPMKKGRVFNFVPGMEAIALSIENGNADVKLRVEQIA